MSLIFLTSPRLRSALEVRMSSCLLRKVVLDE